VGIRTWIALFFWNCADSSVLPINTKIEEAPPNSASPLRLSAFHADIKCESRSWKRFLSILISAMVIILEWQILDVGLLGDGVDMEEGRAAGVNFATG
jgi:hypothetical protein